MRVNFKREILVIFVLVFALVFFLSLWNIIKGYEKELQTLKKEIEEQNRKIEKIFQGKLEVVATAYTSNKICCGKDDGITASGKKATWGTIAMDKRYKFGTKVFIPLFQKTFIVLDRGGAIKGNKIDI